MQPLGGGGALPGYQRAENSDRIFRLQTFAESDYGCLFLISLTFQQGGGRGGACVNHNS